MPMPGPPIPQSASPPVTIIPTAWDTTVFCDASASGGEKRSGTFRAGSSRAASVCGSKRLISSCTGSIISASSVRYWTADDETFATMSARSETLLAGLSDRRLFGRSEARLPGLVAASEPPIADVWTDHSDILLPGLSDGFERDGTGTGLRLAVRDVEDVSCTSRSSRSVVGDGERDRMCSCGDGSR